MLSHPSCWLYEAETPIATPCQSVWRIALTVENHNACVMGHEWWRPIIGGPIWDAVVFETGAPLSGPIFQFTLLVQHIRKIGLLIAELLTNFVKVTAEILKHIGMCPQFEAVYGRIPRNTPRPLMVMDDEEFTGVGEEFIQRPCNDHIYIQKQRSALEAVQVFRECLIAPPVSAAIA